MAVGVRSLWRSVVVSNRFSQRCIGMSSPHLEKALEKLEKNPYYEKYAERISELQRTSPAEFLQRVESAPSARRDKAKESTHLGPPDTRQYSSVLNPKEDLKGAPLVQDKNLNDIFKLDLVKDKDTEEIKIIWEEYHRNKEVICATIPTSTYNAVREKMLRYSTFIFPLPRSQGYEFIMSQCHGHSVHFTPLLAFQVHKENAPECLTMMHYTELQHKGLVLMRGEYDKNVLNGQEAQCLANQFQLYYSGKDTEKSRLLENFTEHPDSFKHMDLVSQLENISLV